MWGIFYHCLKFRPGLSSLFQWIHCPLSVWHSSNPARPSAPRETIILLLIHLSLYCSPNQSPMEWDVAKLLLPSCGCHSNRDSVFAVMSARCGLEVWVLTRTTLVGDNEQDSAVMEMTLFTSATGDSQLAWCVCVWEGESEWARVGREFSSLVCNRVFESVQICFSALKQGWSQSCVCTHETVLHFKMSCFT